ncbi:mucin-12-like [Engystomops pustulosus]|uniref:mucin-12-like n=1 Tax=Engystomops pustulosus TaxID=76066 RepID=UPI003AFA22FE
MSPTLTSTMIRFLFLLTVAAATAQAQTTGQTTTPLKCENGGISDGVRCTCPEFTDGTRCQNIRDRIPIGKYYTATVGVTLTMNYTYHSDLADVSSEKYKEFIVEYNNMMRSLLEGFDGSHKIQNIINKTPLEIETQVFLDIAYNESSSVQEQYREILDNVEKELRTKCPPEPLCNSIVKIKPNILLSEEVIY